jgi:hypothetical protein
MTIQDQPFADYVDRYQASRLQRNRDHDGLFLPLEMLTRQSDGKAFLSVSMSADTRKVFITQQASMLRIVKVSFKWLVVPTTASKLFTRDEFEAAFSALLTSESVDGEAFWCVPADRHQALAAKIAECTLDNSFRALYTHQYLGS